MKKYFLILIVLALAGVNGFAQEEPASDTVWVKVISNRVNAVEFSPDGQFIYAAANDRFPLKVETLTGDIVKEYESFTTVNDLDLSNDGSLLAITGGDNQIAIIDVATEEVLRYYSIPDEVANKYDFMITKSVSISFDNSMVAVVIRGNTKAYVQIGNVLIWETATGEIIKNIEDYWGEDVLFSPVEDILAISHSAAKGEDRVDFYNTNNWEKIFLSSKHIGIVTDISFTRDGSLLCSSTRGGDDIKIWNIEERSLENAINVHYNISSLHFINKNTIVSCGNSYPFTEIDFIITDLHSKENIKEYKTIRALDIHSYNSLIAIADKSNITLLDVENYLGIDGASVNDLNLNIAPNPITSSCKISFSLPANKYASIEISNLDSQYKEKIYSGFLNEGEHNFTWDITDKPNGAYFITLNTSKGSFTQKFIINK